MTGTAVLQKLIDSSSGSMNKVKGAAGPLWRILTFSLADDLVLPKRSLSVSMEPARLSVVYGSRFLSRIRIKGVRTYPFEEGRYPAPANLASTVALARSELKAFRSEITLTIPKTWAIVRSVEFPDTVKESLVNVISYELDRLTPFTPENALYDYRVLSERDGRLLIMLATARIDLIGPYLDAFRERGVPVDRVTVNSSAVASLCSFIHGPQKAIFINISKGGYDGGCAADGVLTSAFSGGFNGADQASNVENMIEEIDRCRMDAEADGNGSPLFLVAGDAAHAGALKARVASTRDMMQGLDDRLRLPAGSQDVVPSATGGMLESLWPEAKGFNLLVKGARKKIRTPLTFTIVLLLVLAAMGNLYVVAPLRVEEKRLQEIDRRIAGMRQEFKKVEELKKEVDTLEGEIASIRDFKKDRPMVLQMVKELTTVLPKNAWLTRLRITDSTVEIEGYAASATELLPKLETSPLLKKVEFASPTFRDARLNSDRFVIKMEIEKTGSTGQPKQ